MTARTMDNGPTPLGLAHEYHDASHEVVQLLEAAYNTRLVGAAGNTVGTEEL